jgi:hypothetical protein
METSVSVASASVAKAVGVQSGTPRSAQGATIVPSSLPQRTRRGRKRLSFGVPMAMPPGVRELWRSAGSEAQSQAHRTCVEIFSLWLGRERQVPVMPRRTHGSVRCLVGSGGWSDFREWQRGSWSGRHSPHRPAR